MRLLLLRHAKSDWASKVDDHERSLTRRGREAAPLMGAYISRKGYTPELVLCSTAVRARETLELVLPGLPAAPRIEYDRGLYLAQWPQLLVSIRQAPSKASRLLLVGHNPGLEELAIALALTANSVAEKSRAEMLAQKFPTSALAVLDFEAPSWPEIAPGLGRLSDFVRPKDLAKTPHADEE